MTDIEKIKTITKSWKKKAQYDRQTAKISALSSGNVGKYEFLTVKMFYQNKDY